MITVLIILKKLKNIVGDYSFKKFKIVKIIIGDYGFRLKVKTMVVDYGFNYLKIF